MHRYFDNIEEATVNNSNFRQVLFTGKYCQLVVMSLQPGEEIGMEVHHNVDQFFRFEEGEAKVLIDGEEIMAKADDALVVPAGSEHNIINASNHIPLKLYTVYSPPNHPAGTVHQTKAEAEAAEAEEHQH